MAAPIPSRDCQLAHAAALAYDIRDRDTASPVDRPEIPTSSANYGAVVGRDLTVFVGGEEMIDGAFVAVMPGGDVVVSIRGTLAPGTGPLWSWVDDWLEDFDVDPVPWHVGPARDVPYGKVEDGFDRAVHELWFHADAFPADPARTASPGVRATLLNLRADGTITPDATVFVTGHSKGAAATYLVASLIRAEPLLKDVPVEVVCFASPYVCDAEFRRCYDRAGLLDHTTRYQNVDDLVPFVPNWLVAAPLALARRLHPKASGGAGPWWTWEYVSMGRLRVITRKLAVVDGAAGWCLAFCRIVLDVLTFQLGRIASAHSMVHERGSRHPTGRYTCGACTPGQPCPPTSEVASEPARAEATAAP